MLKLNTNCPQRVWMAAAPPRYLIKIAFWNARLDPIFRKPAEESGGRELRRDNYVVQMPWTENNGALGVQHDFM